MKPGAPLFAVHPLALQVCEQVRRVHYIFKFVTISVILFVFSEIERHTTRLHGQRLPTLPLKA